MHMLKQLTLIISFVHVRKHPALKITRVIETHIGTNDTISMIQMYWEYCVCGFTSIKSPVWPQETAIGSRNGRYGE